MKILMTITSLNKGGQERQLVELLKGLKNKGGYQIEIVSFSNVVSYREIYDVGYPVHLIKRKPKKDPRAFFKFYRICKKFGPDIIQSWGRMSSIYAVPTVWFSKAKFINFNIYNAPKKMSFWDNRLVQARATFRFSDIVIGNSLAGLKSYNMEPPKGRCIYNGFDFSRVKDLKSKWEVLEEYQIETPKIVGMVGAFHNRKDFFTYIDAAKRVADRRDDVTFLCIGGGENLEKCKAMLDERHQDRIRFTGQISNVESLVNAFTIGVLSTNTDVHGEGIANSIIEYMVLKKPVIATDGGGTPEIVSDGRTGYIVPPFSPDIMAEKVNSLLDDPARCLEMGEKGYLRIQEEFSLTKMVNSFTDLYEELLQRKLPLNTNLNEKKNTHSRAES